MKMLVDFNQNLTSIPTVYWFISMDIFEIICNCIVVILSLGILFLIVFLRRCHTISMLLVGNSCLSILAVALVLINCSIFSLKNDFNETYFEDMYCTFRGYLLNSLAAPIYYSFFLQSFYRYISIVYPACFLCNSIVFQLFSIVFTWLFGFVHSIPYFVRNEIVYNFDNQICQVPLRISWLSMYISFMIYVLPLTLTIIVYFNLVKYVKQLRRHIFPRKKFRRARKELKMVRRTITLILILTIVCFPMMIFLFLSLFNRQPRYHFRIGYSFISISLIFVLITLFYYNRPLRKSFIQIPKMKNSS